MGSRTRSEAISDYSGVQITRAERDDGDRALLLSAAMEGTAHRAGGARRLLRDNLKLASERSLRSLALDAFQHYMFAAEDTLTWVCALLEWEPHSPSFETSLLVLLDRIQVGRKSKTNDYSEAGLRDRFDLMTVADFRRGLSLPQSDAELLARPNWPPSISAPLDPHVGAWLDGVRRIVRGRLNDDRALVRAFNKTKHGLLAGFGEDLDGAPAVILYSLQGVKDGRVNLLRSFVRAKPLDIERRVQWTIQIAAVLHVILSIILGVHFDEWIDTPQWVRDSMSLLGWLPSG